MFDGNGGPAAVRAGQQENFDLQQLRARVREVQTQLTAAQTASLRHDLTPASSDNNIVDVVE